MLMALLLLGGKLVLLGGKLPPDGAELACG